MQGLFIPYMEVLGLIGSLTTHVRGTLKTSWFSTYLQSWKKGRFSTEITFIGKDETFSHHYDPLVITLRIESYDVYRIMINTESSIYLLFLSIIRVLGMKESNIAKKELSSVGFNSITTFTIYGDFSHGTRIYNDDQRCGNWCHSTLQCHPRKTVDTQDESNSIHHLPSHQIPYWERHKINKGRPGKD